jgi:alkanesulfonate monooxygenase SsuD/methylene tetrahydromethanopterin reductase-like flavin-dependent oxidoreductase (luciferase family)
MLSIALPHVDAWNTWWDGYGNTVPGFAALNADIDAAVAKAGRATADVERSACVLVTVDGQNAERAPLPEIAPVSADAQTLARHLHGLAEAGADEAILVLDPITERSVRAIAPALELLDTP